MTLRTGSLGWMTRVAEPRATLGSESVITCRMTSEWSLVVFFFESLSTSTPSRFISRLLGGGSDKVFMSEACLDLDENAGINDYDDPLTKYKKRTKYINGLRRNFRCKSIAAFRSTVDNLEHYVSNTVPALMPPMSEELHLHQTYVRKLLRRIPAHHSLYL